jgi:hypothetical protein
MDQGGVMTRKPQSVRAQGERWLRLSIYKLRKRDLRKLRAGRMPAIGGKIMPKKLSRTAQWERVQYPCKMFIMLQL